MKKIFAIILALAMTFALSATALAATQSPGVPESPAGTITIKGAQAGTTYNLYRIFDLTYDNTDPDNVAVAYTINEHWTDFFAAEGEHGGKQYIVGTDSGSLNPITVGDEQKYINITDDNVVAFVNDVTLWINDHLQSSATPVPTSYVITNVGEGDVTDAGFEVKVDTLGYYLVYPVGATQQETENACLCSLDSTLPDVTINIKAKAPSIEKTIDETTPDTDVEIGQPIPFKITGKVPQITGYTTYTWEVADTMTGLTFDQTTGVKVVIKNATSDLYTHTFTAAATQDNITYSGVSAAGFTLKIDMVAFLAAQTSVHAGDTIEITYKGIVNEDALTNHTGTNSATLTYSNNPGDSTSHGTDTSEVKVYTGKITVIKTDGADKPLPDAKFKLYKKVTGENDQEVIKWYKYDSTNQVVSWVDTEANATEVEATAVGTGDDTTYQAVFKGLEPGVTYWIRESTTPAGYNTALDQSVTISKSTAEDGTVTITDGEVTVVNKKGGTLPGVGGIGTTIFYVIGGLLMVGAAVLLVVRKKMSVTE